MPTIVANADGSYTITVPAPVAPTAPTQVVDVTAGESVEVVNTDATVVPPTGEQTAPTA